MKNNNTKLIVGLGNIGLEYKYTRHNIGFMFLNYLKNEYPFNDFKIEDKFFGKITQASINRNKILLLKPNTFMNLSGKSVQTVAHYYKINPENIIVIHDDLDIQFESFKINTGKGPRAHNGISSIETNLGTKEFSRVRIGIENRLPEEKGKFKGRDYVLSKFKEEELSKLNNTTFKSILEKLELIVLN